MINIRIDNFQWSEDRLKMMSEHYWIKEKILLDLLILKEFNRLKEWNWMQLNNNFLEDYKFKIWIQLNEFLKIWWIKHFIKISKDIYWKSLSENTIYDLKNNLWKSKISQENINFIANIINSSK